MPPLKPVVSRVGDRVDEIQRRVELRGRMSAARFPHLCKMGLHPTLRIQ